MINTEELRKNNLMNLTTILAKQYKSIDSKQCKVLSDCFDILAKDKLTHSDSIDIDRLIAQGKFRVALPY